MYFLFSTISHIRPALTIAAAMAFVRVWWTVNKYIDRGPTREDWVTNFHRKYYILYYFMSVSGNYRTSELSQSSFYLYYFFNVRNVCIGIRDANDSALLQQRSTSVADNYRLKKKKVIIIITRLPITTARAASCVYVCVYMILFIIIIIRDEI